MKRIPDGLYRFLSRDYLGKTLAVQIRGKPFQNLLKDCGVLSSLLQPRACQYYAAYNLHCGRGNYVHEG